MSLSNKGFFSMNRPIIGLNISGLKPEKQEPAKKPPGPPKLFLPEGILGESFSFLRKRFLDNEPFVNERGRQVRLVDLKVGSWVCLVGQECTLTIKILDEFQKPFL